MHKFSPVSGVTTNKHGGAASSLGHVAWGGGGGAATLDGVRATDWVCWEYFFRKPCVVSEDDLPDETRREGEGEGEAGAEVGGLRHPRCRKAHVFGRHDQTCGGRIREALGQIKTKRQVRQGRRVCRYGETCTRWHPSDDEVRRALGEWWRRERGGGTSRPPTWSVLSKSNFAGKDARARATATASEQGAEAVKNASGRSTWDAWDDAAIAKSLARAARLDGKDGGGGGIGYGDGEDAAAVRTRETRWIVERVGKKRSESEYVGRLLVEPFFDEIMADHRLRRLFLHKKSYKEVTEAYGAMHQVRNLLPRLRRSESGADATAEYPSDDGAGALIFDVCSGRGITALLLSFWFPGARIVMMDSNGAMDLLHVRARSNLVFRHVDLYGESAVEAIREETEAARARDAGFVAVVVGVHLCGALSPRLIDLAFRMSEIDGMILCPCCIKGALGGDCKRAAKERGCDPYVVLCETFRNLCEDELASSTVSSGAEAGSVIIGADSRVLSPVNCFISVAKGGGTRGDACCQPCR